jgi:hypothetical protein
MLIRRPSDIPSSKITDESLFWNRRSFIKAAGLGEPTEDPFSILCVLCGSSFFQ